MRHPDLGRFASLSLPQIGLASGATEVQGSSVDMSGYLGCLFVLVLQAMDAIATCTLAIEGSDDNQSWAAVPGASSVSNFGGTAANKVLAVDVQQPAKRYLRPALTRAGTTNSAIGGIVALRYGPRGTPPAAEATRDRETVQVVGV